MDLKRPDSREQARDLVETYMAGEPEVPQEGLLQFSHRRLTLEEIREQLNQTGLQHLSPRVVSDLHVAVAGHLD